MENNTITTNKIYAEAETSGIVTSLFSTAFKQPKDMDVLIEEGNKEYHTHIHLKYRLVDLKGNYNYKLIDGALVELTEEEKAILFPIPTPTPTESERLASLESALSALMGVV